MRRGKEGVATGLQRPAEEDLHLNFDVGTDEAHLGFRDAALTAESGDQGINLAGRYSCHVRLHHYGLKGLVDPPAWLENRGQEAASAQFRDGQWNVAHLGSEHTEPVAVAVANPLLTAFMAIGTEHGGHLQLDQLLQAMAHQIGNQLTSCAAIQ